MPGEIVTIFKIYCVRIMSKIMSKILNKLHVLHVDRELYINGINFD